MQPEKSCIDAGSLSTALGLTVDNLRTPPRKKLELTSRATAVPGDTTLTGGFPSRVRDAFLAFRLTVTLCHMSRITVELLLASPTPLPRSYLNLTNLTTTTKRIHTNLNQSNVLNTVDKATTSFFFSGLDQIFTVQTYLTEMRQRAI